MSGAKQFAYETSVRSKLTGVELSAIDKKKEQTALAYMLMHCPFFADLMLTQLKIVNTPDCPRGVAATDEFSIFINPTIFYDDKLTTIANRAFIFCHEVMHCVLKHCTLMVKMRQTGVVNIGAGKTLPYKNNVMGKACDYVINAMLKDSNSGVMPEKLGGLYDAGLSEKGMESVIDVYIKLMANNDDGCGGFDVLIAPGEASDKDPSERIDAEWQLAVASAAAAAKAQGQLPASLEQFVKSIVEPKVPWQDHMRSEINRTLGSDGYDWTRLDRRLIARPDRICFASPSDFSCGTIVIGFDTSGSLWDEKTQAIFFGEMDGILRDMHPRLLIVMFCDVKVKRTDTVEEGDDLGALRCKAVPGGGGTRFEPVFDEIEKMEIEPDVLIYLTDGFGSFPSKAPFYPVIWGMTAKVVPPFGSVVHVEV